jgi:hypothetical protein
MTALTVLTFLSSLAAAHVIPRTPLNDVPEGHCCFTLSDTSSGQVVQQDSASGDLAVGGGAPNGWYCLDLDNPEGILLDDWNNACFITPGAQLVCLDPIPGIHKWSLLTEDGATWLAYDGHTDYQACEEGGGAESLWTADKEDASQCRITHLEPKGLRGQC